MKRFDENEVHYLDMIQIPSLKVVRWIHIIKRFWNGNFIFTESEDDADTTPVVVKVTRESELPDFGQSPIDSQHSELSDQETPRNTRSAGKDKNVLKSYCSIWFHQI